MATNDELAAKYFFQPGDALPPTQPALGIYKDSKFTPLIDGKAYEIEIDAALANTGLGATPAENASDFIYIQNWWLGLEGGRYIPPEGKFMPGPGPRVVDLSPYILHGGQGDITLREGLILKAQRGVDLRVMGWVSYAVMDSSVAQLSGAGSIANVNALSIRSVIELRNRLADPKTKQPFGNAILNVISHPAGAVHIKLVVIRNRQGVVGFTSGLDFVRGRFADPRHAEGQTWHDIAVKVEGPAVEHLYTHFIDMWTENLRLPVRSFLFDSNQVPSYLPTTKAIAGGSLVFPSPPPSGFEHQGQGLRTVPAHVYPTLSALPKGTAPQHPPGAASGLFEVRAAWQKAIRNAGTFVYIEDQCFWSNEIFDWLGQQVRSTASLRVILVTSGAPDPDDPSFPMRQFRTETLNEHLLKPPGGPPLTAAQIKQIAFFHRFGDSAFYPAQDTASVTPPASGRAVVVLPNAPDRFRENVLADDKSWLRNDNRFFRILSNRAAAKGANLTLEVEVPGPDVPTAGTANSEVWLVLGITVHSKTTIIDDGWAVIGSANFMRRSLYTDWEHSVSFVDTTAVKEYRKALWNEIFRHTSAGDFEDIQSALHGWNPEWGSAGGASPPLPTRPSTEPPSPNYLVRVPIPYTPATAFTADVRRKVDLYTDPDSRDSWGGVP